MDERAFQSPRVESEFDRKWPRPLLVPSRSGELTGTPKGFALSGLFMEAFESVAGGFAAHRQY